MSACRSKRATSWIGVPAWTSQLAQVRRRSCGVQGAIPARFTAVAKPFLTLAMRSPSWLQKTQVVYRDEPRAVLLIGLENAVDDADREVSVPVQRGAEPMNESHRAGSRLWACPRAVRAPAPLDGIKGDAQSAVESLAVMLEVIA